MDVFNVDKKIWGYISLSKLFVYFSNLEVPISDGMGGVLSVQNRPNWLSPK